jgi:hypothetical protein
MCANWSAVAEVRDSRVVEKSDATHIAEKRVPNNIQHTHKPYPASDEESERRDQERDDIGTHDEFILRRGSNALANECLHLWPYPESFSRVKPHLRCVSACCLRLAVSVARLLLGVDKSMPECTYLLAPCSLCVVLWVGESSDSSEKSKFRSLPNKYRVSVATEDTEEVIGIALNLCTR